MICYTFEILILFSFLDELSSLHMEVDVLVHMAAVRYGSVICCLSIKLFDFFIS
jgi:hypothetical protein